ncbi:MAG TPA: hypothetical protein VL475_09695, partial [Planctomycetaceae bacterium]|nr:hypothetical protein [Planctomycetaceae bacterium]
IEKILEASDQKPKSVAPPPSDEYVVAEGVDEPYDDDDGADAALYESPSGSESRFGLPAQGGADSAPAAERAAGAARAPRKKPRRPRADEEEPAPAFSAAGIAEGLMARGDNLVKHDVVERKAGRPFGGADKGVTEEEGFGLREITGYFARYAIPIIVGLALSGSLYYWWYSGWIRGDLPPLVQVTGTVTLDGVPLPQAEVHFHPMQSDPRQPNLKLASSVGFTDANGKYSLIYVNNVTGAVVGKHRVQIFATDEQGRQIIPPQFNSRTKLTVEVKADGKDPINIDVNTKEKDTSGGTGGFTPPSR